MADAFGAAVVGKLPDCSACFGVQFGLDCIPKQAELMRNPA